MPNYNKFMASSGDNTKFRCQVSGQKTDFISFVIQRIVGAQVDGPVLCGRMPCGTRMSNYTHFYNIFAAIFRTKCKKCETMQFGCAMEGCRASWTGVNGSVAGLALLKVLCQSVCNLPLMPSLRLCIKKCIFHTNSPNYALYSRWLMA